MSARSSFEQTISQADQVLKSGASYFPAKYARALALPGQALLAEDGDQRGSRIGAAQEAYVAVTDSCAATGIVADALRLFDELHPLDRENSLASVRSALTKR